MNGETYFRWGVIFHRSVVSKDFPVLKHFRDTAMSGTKSGSRIARVGANLLGPHFGLLKFALTAIAILGGDGKLDSVAMAEGVRPPGVHLSSSKAPAQPEERELRSLLNALREEIASPGAILGVQSGDNPPQVIACGYANRESKTLLTPDAPYFLGSITKTYTAAVVLRLIEEGKLSLDDTLARFLPDFPGGAGITVRELLEQTSGLSDFYTDFYYQPDRIEMIKMVTKPWTQDELLEIAGKARRTFAPGTDWDYSSTNYFLLGVIAERAGGISFHKALRRWIYQPLDLRRTWVVGYEPSPTALPTGYMGPVEGWKHSEMFGELGPTTVLDKSSAEWSCGGMAAPADENMRFLRALLGGNLVSQSSLETMKKFRRTPPLGVFSKKPVAKSTFEGYGMGLIKMERGGLTLIGHGGMFSGHTAGVWHIPELNVTIALYFNRGLMEQRSALDQVVRLVTSTADPRPGR